MTNTSYNEQRARTRAADEAHRKMLCWYAEQLSVEFKDVRTAIVSLSKERAKQLYQQYQELL